MTMIIRVGVIASPSVRLAYCTGLPNQLEHWGAGGAESRLICLCFARASRKFPEMSTEVTQLGAGGTRQSSYPWHTSSDGCLSRRARFGRCRAKRTPGGRAWMLCTCKRAAGSAASCRVDLALVWRVGASADRRVRRLFLEHHARDTRNLCGNWDTFPYAGHQDLATYTIYIYYYLIYWTSFQVLLPWEYCCNLKGCLIILNPLRISLRFASWSLEAGQIQYNSIQCFSAPIPPTCRLGGTELAKHR